MGIRGRPGCPRDADEYLVINLGERSPSEMTNHEKELNKRTV